MSNIKKSGSLEELKKTNDRIADKLNVKSDSKRSGKGGKKRRNPKDRTGKPYEGSKVGSYSKGASMDDFDTNDIRYWNKTSGYPNISKFKWDTIVGFPRNINTFFTSSNLPHGVDFEEGADTFNPVQIMNVIFTPGPGWAYDVHDGVNRGLARIMSKIRSTLSTSNIGFETADLGIFLSATSSIALNIGYAKRILESMDIWNDVNMTYPRGLAKAQGNDWKSLVSHRNEYAARLNSLIDMYNDMNIPDMFDIYDRQYSLVHNYFADESSNMAQVYMFTPKGYYKYDDTNSRATWYNEVLSDLDFENVCSIIESQIDAWYRSSDLYLINGVLLRALKDAPKQVIPHYVGDPVNPVVDEAFLSQIMNMTICGNLQECNITQDPTTQDYIIWTPKPANANGTSQPGQLLRFFKEDVTPDECIEMTRLMNFSSNFTDLGDVYMAYCGTEIVNSVELLKYNSTTDSLQTVYLHSNTVYCDFSPTVDDPQTNMENFERIAAVSPFRYLPTIMSCSILKDFDDNWHGIFHGVVGDLYNWTVYPSSDYKAMQFQLYQSIWTPKVKLD